MKRILSISLLLAAGIAFAQQNPQTYRMTTPVPPGIATPDKVTTSLGTLSFHDGVPDDATARKVYDNLDAQRALQAYLDALPAVSMMAMVRGLDQFGAVNRTAVMHEARMDSKSLFLTANTNTTYTWMHLSTKNGPLVVEVPPKVLGLFDDSWFRWVGDIGILGADKGAGGKYLLLPPEWKGEIPEGYHVLHSRTYTVWGGFRTFPVNGDYKPGIDLVEKTMRIYPLTDAGNPPALHFEHVSGKYFNTIAPGDTQVFSMIHQFLQEEPNSAIDAVTLGNLAAIGIVKGKPFAPDARMKKILADAAKIGDATVRAMTYRQRNPDAYFYPGSAWRTGFLGGYLFENNGVRELDSYYSFFFYATGVTPAMEMKVIGKGSQYAAAFVDSKGRGFDGSHTYKLRLPANIPVKDFWSLIAYDTQTRSMLQTDQQYPQVGSQSPGLKMNTDGSIDVYFGPKAPIGLDGNWVQTVPGKGWSVLLRLYGALEPWFDKTWRPGEFERID